MKDTRGVAEQSARSTLPPKRRHVLLAGGGSALGLLVAGLRCVPHSTGPRSSDAAASPDAAGSPAGSAGLGSPLIARPGQLLALPKGFSYVIVQRSGDPLTDGHRMPPQPDGMACFQDAKGRFVLLRNHELGDARFLKRFALEPSALYRDGLVPEQRYRAGQFGGVSRVVLDAGVLHDELRVAPATRSKAVVSSNLVLTGTAKNCAGGVHDGGWITCEESGADDHGFAFMTRPDDDAVRAPRRIDSWGRLYREAVVVDERTGIVYMTEDRDDGLFYRFVPDERSKPMGSGRLQALVVPGVPHTHPYTHRYDDPPAKPHWKPRQTWRVSWVDIPDRMATAETTRQQGAKLGATKFYRGEGIALDASGVWFAASTAGRSHGGQIFRYRAVSSGEGDLVLEHEVEDRQILSCPDNLVMTPWGELLMSEDNYNRAGGVTHQFMRLMTASGRVIDVARNEQNVTERDAPGGEFTGACFSPDGRILFVNIQHPTQMTLAITGPWPTQKS